MQELSTSGQVRRSSAVHHSPSAPGASSISCRWRSLVESRAAGLDRDEKHHRQRKGVVSGVRDGVRGLHRCYRLWHSELAAYSTDQGQEPWLAALAAHCLTKTKSMPGHRSPVKACTAAA